MTPVNDMLAETHRSSELSTFDWKKVEAEDSTQNQTFQLPNT